MPVPRLRDARPAGWVNCFSLWASTMPRAQKNSKRFNSQRRRNTSPIWVRVYNLCTTQNLSVGIIKTLNQVYFYSAFHSSIYNTVWSHSCVLCYCIVYKYASVADPEWFIPDPDPAFAFQSSGSGFGSRSIPKYLYITGNFQKTNLTFVNSIKKKNLPTICDFLFHSTGTVLQYT